MHAEVISIGDELTSGQRLDTNSQWLSEHLGGLGIRVMYHTTVADDLEANMQVFRTAAARADIVVSTGGLGPTADDLTRDALAAVVDEELVLDLGALAHIESLFARRNRPMPPRNRVQAMFPRGSRIIPNPAGTAPGIDLYIARAGLSPARVFALPGVPAEMHEMWAQAVAPAIAAISGGRIIVHRRIKCFGAGESELEAMLPDLIRRGRSPQVGITVSGATITLRITAEGSSPAECQDLIAPTEAVISETLGSLVFGEEEDELEHAIARLLVQRNVTLAVAEIGTGGLVAHWLSEVPQARRHFLGGYVTSGCAGLVTGLGVDAGTLQRHGPISQETAAAMAIACRKQFGADFGLAISEFPAFDPSAKEPAEYCFAVASAEGVHTKAAPYVTHPSILKVLGAKRAMNFLRLRLLGS